MTDVAEKMGKILAGLKREFSMLRTGRATLALVDGVRVEAYGTPTPLNQVGTLAIPDSRTISITPWDKTLIVEIEKAIQKSDLGLQPTNDGNVVRINIPILTEERRKDLIKIAKKLAEDHRIGIRNVRREANDEAKKQQKSSEITEDDLRRTEQEVQKKTDQHVGDIDKLLNAKEQEILEV